jgi:hypothetical protein
MTTNKEATLLAVAERAVLLLSQQLSVAPVVGPLVQSNPWDCSTFYRTYVCCSYQIPSSTRTVPNADYVMHITAR